MASYEFLWNLDTYYCLLFSSCVRIRVSIRFNDWLLLLENVGMLKYAQLENA